MSEQLPIDFTRTHARTNDPSTSHEAAALVAVRAGTTKHKILNAMISDQSRPWTSEEIATRAGVSYGSSWKRLSDLKREGRVAVADELGVSETGSRCSRYYITVQGMADHRGA